MRNRIEYLKAKYSKPIDDSILYHIASDLVDNRKRLVEVYEHKPKLRILTGTRRERLRKAISRIRDLNILIMNLKGKERHQQQKKIATMKKSIKVNFPKREEVKAL